MNITYKIFLIIVFPFFIFQSENARSETLQSAAQLRGCYQSVLDEAATEDDRDEMRGTFTIDDVHNPDTFFADCESIDYQIIKEMYVEYYNTEKLTVSSDYHDNYEQYKQHVMQTIVNLKIDYTPEDLNRLEQWEPLSKAIQSVFNEYNNRSKSTYRSNDYINDIYLLTLLFNKMDDLALGSYAYNYLINISEKNCSFDCEIIFDLFKNILSSRPEAMKKLLSLSNQYYEFIHDNIELGYRYAELKRQSSKKSNTKKITDPKKYITTTQDLNINNDSNSKSICEQIKHIPFTKNCRSAQFILNKLRTVDLVADEI